MATYPTRAQVEQAEPLDFHPAGRAPLAVAHMAYRGVLVELDLQQLDARALADVEQRIARLLDRDGWAAPAAAPAAPMASQERPRRAAQRVEPIYQPDGTACCPTHKRPLKQGQYGRYCPAKDDSTERGFCALRFTE